MALRNNHVVRSIRGDSADAISDFPTDGYTLITNLRWDSQKTAQPVLLDVIGHYRGIFLQVFHPRLKVLDPLLHVGRKSRLC